MSFEPKMSLSLLVYLPPAEFLDHAFSSFTLNGEVSSFISLTSCGAWFIEFSDLTCRAWFGVGDAAEL